MEKKDTKVVDKMGPKKIILPKPFEASLRTYSTPTLTTGKQQLSGSAGLQNKAWLKNTFRTGQLTSTKKKDFTSTPSRQTQLSLACDISAIETEKSNMPLTKEPLDNTFRSNYRMKSRVPQTPCSKKSELSFAVTEGVSRKGKADEVREAELALLHIEALQATYLASKAKKSLAERDHLAVEKLTKLSKANQILMQQEKTLNVEVDGLKILNQIMKHCEKEESMLKPLTKVLPGIMEHYEEISAAVDTIRHKLYTPGIAAPLDSTAEDQISEILRGISGLLLSLLEKSKCCTPDFEEAEKLTAIMFDLIKEITSEMKRCLNMLKKAHNLMITETSLKIGEMNLSEN